MKYHEIKSEFAAAEFLLLPKIVGALPLFSRSRLSSIFLNSSLLWSSFSICYQFNTSTVAAQVKAMLLNRSCRQSRQAEASSGLTGCSCHSGGGGGGERNHQHGPRPQDQDQKLPCHCLPNLWRVQRRKAESSGGGPCAGSPWKKVQISLLVNFLRNPLFTFSSSELHHFVQTTHCTPQCP